MSGIYSSNLKNRPRAITGQGRQRKKYLKPGDRQGTRARKASSAAEKGNRGGMDATWRCPYF